MTICVTGLGHHDAEDFGLETRINICVPGNCWEGCVCVCVCVCVWFPSRHIFVSSDTSFLCHSSQASSSIFKSTTKAFWKGMKCMVQYMLCAMQCAFAYFEWGTMAAGMGGMHVHWSQLPGDQWYSTAFRQSIPLTPLWQPLTPKVPSNKMPVFHISSAVDNSRSGGHLKPHSTFHQPGWQ